MMHLRDRLRRVHVLPPGDDPGWTPFAWLIYFPIFFVQLAIDRTLDHWAMYVVATGIFLVTYFRGYWLRDRRLIGIILTQTGLAIAFTPINGGAYVLFIYAASFAARLDRTPEAVRWIAYVTLTGIGAAWACHAPVYYWIAHAIFTPLIGSVNLHRSVTDRANAKLRLAQEEIKRLAAVTERERIARDLHDVLGHTLSLIVLKAELASKLAERDPQRAAREIHDVEQVSRAALREIRTAIAGYRPTLSDELVHAQELLDAARITANVDVHEVLLPRAGEEVIALALREAITNVVRHSGASRARIRLWRDGTRAMLEVADDGHGSTAAEGAGLRGMRERVEAVGGYVNRAMDGGMRLTVALPIECVA
jgi:two-component system, NarL family, sensor histidine kinase DesK